MNFPLNNDSKKNTNNESLEKELDRLLKVAKNTKQKVMELFDRLFSNTAVSLSGTVSTRDMTIKDLLVKFRKTAELQGITNIWIDGDIVRWFGEVAVSEKIAGPSRLLRFATGMTNKDIVDTCKALLIYQEYSLCDAINRAIALVAIGELDDKNNRGVVIYLTNNRNDQSCELDLWRLDDGELCLRLVCVDLAEAWDAGHGVLVKEEFL